jgi:hypothetical protein
VEKGTFEIRVTIEGENDSEVYNVYDSITTSIEEGDHNTSHAKVTNVTYKEE